MTKSDSVEAAVNDFLGRMARIGAVVDEISLADAAFDRYLYEVGGEPNQSMTNDGRFYDFALHNTPIGSVVIRRFR